MLYVCVQLGLEMYHGVGLIGFNSAEWFIADLACIFAGGLATGVYTTNSADACRYVVNRYRLWVVFALVAVPGVVASDVLVRAHPLTVPSP